MWVQKSLLMFQKQWQNFHSHSHSWKFGSKGVILNTILHSFPFPGDQLDRQSLNSQQFHSPVYKNRKDIPSMKIFEKSLMALLYPDTYTGKAKLLNY